MNVTKEVLIESSLSKIYQAFYNFKHWIRALSDVLDVKIFYDDGYHQEFSMTVSRPGGEETVKGIRFCEPDKTIELFQTQPPPLFKKMMGTWRFSNDNKGGVIVSASREFEILDDDKQDSHLNDIKKMLSSYLDKNLNLFKRYIENDFNN